MPSSELERVSKMFENKKPATSNSKKKKTDKELLAEAILSFKKTTHSK